MTVPLLLPFLLSYTPTVVYRRIFALPTAKHDQLIVKVAGGLAGKARKVAAVHTFAMLSVTGGTTQHDALTSRRAYVQVPVWASAETLARTEKPAALR
jgi:phage tail sheath protein FI